MNQYCRHCDSVLNKEILDLGNQPPSNAYLECNSVNGPEITYPLKVFVCEKCWLVQIPEVIKPKELFTPEYAYFSSISSSWLNHCKEYCINVIKKLHLNKSSQVIELASNDGYLLQYFKNASIPCIGVEPTHETAQESRNKGINTVEAFFCHKFSDKLPKADLVIANNVLAHVPDINDFIKGIKNILKKDAVATIEFPHLLELLKFNQFDTIYHEHYSYLSLNFIKKLAQHADLKLINVEKLKTHGGSLRVWLKNTQQSVKMSDNCKRILDKEEKFGLNNLKAYFNLQKNAFKIKKDLLNFLYESNDDNKTVVGYGAAAKGNTLLNYAGIKKDLIKFVADKSIHKQGKFLPGSHIEVVSPEKILEYDSLEIIVFPWNLIDEIKKSFKDKNLYTCIPELKKWI